MIAGTLAGLLTMAVHPTGRDVVANSLSGGHNFLAIGAHALSIAAQPVMLAGLLPLTAQLGRKSEIASYLAFILYSLAAVAVLIAAVASGLIVPSLTENLQSANEVIQEVVRSQMHFAGEINQAFAKVYVMFSSAAIALWSLAMLRTELFSRALAALGLIVSALLIAGVAVGHLTLGIHGFGAVVLAEGAWMIATGLRLRALPA